MKKTLQNALILSVTLLIILIIGAAGHKFKDINKIQKFNFSIEDSIDLTLHGMHKITGDKLRSDCRSHILINCTTPLDEVVDKIDISHFDELSDIASKINTGYTGRHIFAVRFIYGMDDNKKLKLIYQPLLLRNTSPDTAKVGVGYESDTCKIYYIYDRSANPKFQAIDQSEVKTLVKKYRNNIFFKTGEGKGMPICRSYNSASDSTGDVRYNVFSFQELKSVIRDHNGSLLYILNAAETKKVGHKNYLKHILLLGSDQFNTKNISKHINPAYFYNKYGNLSHLCPPSCGNILFNYNLQKF